MYDKTTIQVILSLFPGIVCGIKGFVDLPYLMLYFPHHKMLFYEKKPYLYRFQRVILDKIKSARTGRFQIQSNGGIFGIPPYPAA